MSPTSYRTAPPRDIYEAFQEEFSRSALLLYYMRSENARGIFEKQKKFFGGAVWNPGLYFWRAFVYNTYNRAMGLGPVLIPGILRVRRQEREDVAT